MTDGVKTFLAKHWALAIEPAGVLALLSVAFVMSALWPSPPARPFLAEMGCAGYLLPKGTLDPSGSNFRELRTAKERADTFGRAAREAGFDGRTSHAVGEAAAHLCNLPAKKPSAEGSAG